MFEDIESDEDNGRFQERPSSGSCFEKSGGALAGDGGDAEGVDKFGRDRSLPLCCDLPRQGDHFCPKDCDLWLREWYYSSHLVGRGDQYLQYWQANGWW